MKWVRPGITIVKFEWIAYPLFGEAKIVQFLKSDKYFICIVLEPSSQTSMISLKSYPKHQSNQKSLCSDENYFGPVCYTSRRPDLKLNSFRA